MPLGETANSDIGDKLLLIITGVAVAAISDANNGVATCAVKMTRFPEI